MLSKRYVSTEVDRRTWLHVPSGNNWSISNDTNQVHCSWNIKRLILRCIHHFKSNFINNMDHMRISGTEPSSVILSLTKYFKKLKSDAQKVSKQAKAKRDGVINPQNYNLNQFLTRKILMLSKRYESTEVDRRTWLYGPSGTHWSTRSNENVADFKCKLYISSEQFIYHNLCYINMCRWLYSLEMSLSKIIHMSFAIMPTAMKRPNIHGSLKEPPPCVIKSTIRHRMKFTWKYPDVWGLFLDGIAVFSWEAGKRSTTGYKS